MAPDKIEPFAPVHAIGWFDGRFGYNVHTRNFFDCLSRRLPVVASPLIEREGPWKEDFAAIDQMTGWAPRATIALLYGSMMRILRNRPGRHIAYTVWESTKLPDKWMAPLREADDIWIPTHWGREVLADNGFPIERIHVVPEGVDPAIFHPEVEATEALQKFTGFKFLNIGRFEERKGTRKLIRCFDKAFGPDDDVRLVLACDNAHDPDFNLPKILTEMNLRNRRKLIYIPPMRGHHLLAHLYTACDAFVSPFRAEGWGLPIVEAMACGLPVIATGYSGPTEFLGSDTYRIDFKKIDIEEPYFSSWDGQPGQWADADEDHLIALMREVYENRDAAKARGLKGSEHVRTHFNWDKAAAKAANLLS